VNRKDLQALANLRLREAQALFKAREFSGAYYLAGYAVECALKACIAKQVKRHDFPDKKSMNDAHTHDLEKLSGLANLESSRLALAQANENFRKNWDIITSWSEASRYKTFDKLTCRIFLDAIMEEQHGVMPWIKQV